MPSLMSIMISLERCLDLSFVYRLSAVYKVVSFISNFYSPNLFIPKHFFCCRSINKLYERARAHTHTSLTRNSFIDSPFGSFHLIATFSWGKIVVGWLFMQVLHGFSWAREFFIYFLLAISLGLTSTNPLKLPNFFFSFLFIIPKTIEKWY